ncbi:hypothetical protein Scep_030913 [Stephania cephalantha]|uniref:Uncharacterized protein n=1 Tax=Stephania cephalantha TaxID=152367 RepID=A0AAP0E3Z2_9MAGN
MSLLLLLKKLENLNTRDLYVEGGNGLIESDSGCDFLIVILAFPLINSNHWTKAGVGNF